MKFTAERNHILAAVKAAHGAVERRNAIPVLACLHIRADAGLQITGTNLDMTAKASCEASVSQPGQAVASADDLLKWLTAAPTGSLVMAESDDRALRLSAGKMTLALSLTPTEDFPFPNGENDECVEIVGGIAALQAVAPFHSKEEVRYYLQGVAFDKGHAVATDGHRLGATPCATEASGIIPYRAFPMINAADRLFLGKWSWRAEAENLTVSGKQIDGQFPDWTRIIPKPEPGCQIDATALEKAIASVILGRASAVRITGENGEMTVKAEVFIGESAESVDAVDLDGEFPSRVFSASYLQDGLKVFAGQRVTLAMIDDKLLITGATDLRVVIMPQRG